MFSYIFNPAHNNVLGEREESYVVQIYFCHDCRLGFSHLKEHKFKHNFQDSVDPLCSCGIETESTKHFLLHCANFSIQRKTLFDKLTELNIDVLTRNDDYIVKPLLLGQQDFDNATNKILLEATIDFIIATERFDCPLL